MSLITSARRAPSEFVELCAEIEITSYRSCQTNAEANAKPRLISVVCITGTNLWRIENDWSQNSVSQWFFDGTNVYESVRITKPLSQETRETLNRTGGPGNLTIRIWPSLDGHPLGDAGVNIL